MPTPRVGKSARGSRSGRPIMVVLDFVGRRWLLRILWELRSGPLGFNELQQRCAGISSSVLAQRLGELRESNLVTVGDDRIYVLTREAERLGEILLELDKWAAQWARSNARR